MSSLRMEICIGPQPIPGSWYTIYGQPANLNRPMDYPIEAVCVNCGKPIRAATFIDNWVHFDRDIEQKAAER